MHRARKTVFNILIACLLLQLIACTDTVIVEDIVMNASRLQDMRQPTLTQLQIELLVSRYGVTRDLVVTEETLQILMTEDVFPESIIEIVLLLPTEQVPDEIYNKLANLFLTELSLEQMARFIELCFDTYEHPNDSTSMLLLANTERFRRLRRIMEDLLVDSRYEDRDMMHRYSTFVSASFIPVAVSNNPTEISAFSIVEHADFTLSDLFPGGSPESVLISFFLNYIGLRRNGRTEATQNIQIFKTAVTGQQLSVLEYTLLVKYSEKELAARTLRQKEEIREDRNSTGTFIYLICRKFEHACTWVVFSDESLVTLIIAFPLGEEPLDYGESYEYREDGSVRHRLIAARALPELESVESEASEEELFEQNGASEESIVEQNGDE